MVSGASSGTKTVTGITTDDAIECACQYNGSLASAASVDVTEHVSITAANQITLAAGGVAWSSTILIMWRDRDMSEDGSF